MAVKVRCPTCEKVLSAPDAARGKAVKCPACETKVKIPTGDSSAGRSDGGRTTARRSSTKAPAKKAVGSESTEFLAGLDLSKVAESSEAMCPKCGAEMPEDATECPKCGVDPTTGQLSSSARKRLSRKGPDPALYYKTVWSDAWAFTKANIRVALRTTLYFLVLSGLAGGLAFLAVWLKGMPPKIFCGAFAVVITLAFPGWIWHLTVETVRATISKKMSIRGVHFDMFQNIALGVKTILWYIVFGAWLPFVGLMYPLAMIQMSMPVTTKGWIMPVMVPIFFRNLLPTLYCWLVHLATFIVTAILPVAAAGTLIATGIAASLQNKVAISGAYKWTLVGVSLTFALLGVLVSSFTMLFNMRVIGLLAYYFKDKLDLVTLVAEKTYVHKEVKLDAFGQPIKTSGKKATEAVLLVVVLGIIVAVGYFVYLRLFKK